VLRIWQTAWQEMIAHCWEAVPHEAVGMLVGRGGTASRVDALRNIVPPPESMRYFLADPYDQFLAERRIAAAGCQLVGIYHSHPDGGASMSSDDIDAQGRQSCLKVIVAFPVANPSAVVVRAFGMSRNKPIEVPISVLS
jgi:proteasome lid subunit RPN8/RPN11